MAVVLSASTPNLMPMTSAVQAEPGTCVLSAKGFTALTKHRRKRNPTTVHEQHTKVETNIFKNKCGTFTVRIYRKDKQGQTTVKTLAEARVKLERVW